MSHVRLRRWIGLVSMVWLGSLLCWGQEGAGSPLTERERMLLERIERLEQRLSVLEGKTAGSAAAVFPAPSASTQSSQTIPASETGNTAGAPGASDAAPVASPADSALAFADGTTLNFGFDGYYGYNFNHPLGRINLLRANDVLSDSFSLSQAVVMVERAPDVAAHRRLGYRLDLMFGQQTETLQGSAANEVRPQVYRNIFQAYGSYVFPIGHGLQVDFGKFASALGVEDTYTKDQLNYSRSYFYNYLPYYHMGLRATYNVSDQVNLQYWLVNGASQTEDFNGFKSQAAIVTLKPNSAITWNINYYEGQEQRDLVPVASVGIPDLPTQPGLSTQAVTGRHDGREHIIDSYATITLGPKWSSVLEGDYVVSRVSAQGAPLRAYGGAGYLHRQVTSAFALNGRFEYLADRGGLFSGVRQDLKDITLTGVYQFVDGFQTRLEYRRDFSNVPFFLTNNPANLASAQTSLTVGMLWWFGGKQGIW